MLEMLDSSTLDNTSSFAFHSGLYLVWLISTLRDRSSVYVERLIVHRVDEQWRIKARERSVE